jgi:hypothetical protein
LNVYRRTKSYVLKQKAARKQTGPNKSSIVKTLQRGTLNAGKTGIRGITIEKTIVTSVSINIFNQIFDGACSETRYDSWITKWSIGTSLNWSVHWQKPCAFGSFVSAKVVKAFTRHQFSGALLALSLSKTCRRAMVIRDGA